MFYDGFGDFNRDAAAVESGVTSGSGLLEEMLAAAYAPSAPPREEAADRRHHPEYDYRTGSMVVPAEVIMRRIPPALLVDSFVSTN